MPSSTARRASSAEPTCSHTRVPARCSASIQTRGGCPQWNDATATPAAQATSICAELVNPVMKLTLNGCRVADWMASMVAANALAGMSPTPIEPRPPASQTATARSGVMPTNAIPACAMGWSTLYTSVKRVEITFMMVSLARVRSGRRCRRCRLDWPLAHSGHRRSEA
jgi:hypothetical protein